MGIMDSSSPCNDSRHLSVHKMKIEEMKHKINATEGLELLMKLSKWTAPLRARHKFKLGTLKEFYPANKGLLGMNMNRGSTILIRLRNSADDSQFLPWHDLLGTMIHELTHNEIAAHSHEFYELMDKLYTEVEQDEDTGLIHRYKEGAGLDHKNMPTKGGHILGGDAKIPLGRWTSRDSGSKIVSKVAKEAAANAAEKRFALAQLSGSSGRHLDSSSAKPLTKEGRKAAMRRAAERRWEEQARLDSCSCASSSLELENRASEDLALGGGSTSSAGIKHNEDTSAKWACTMCTLINECSTTSCILCGNSRDRDSTTESSHENDADNANDFELSSKRKGDDKDVLDITSEEPLSPPRKRSRRKPNYSSEYNVNNSNHGSTVFPVFEIEPQEGNNGDENHDAKIAILIQEQWHREDQIATLGFDPYKSQFH